MANVKDLSECTCRINGVEFGGWSDGNDTVQFPEIEGLTARTGADSKKEFIATGERGGEMVFRFLPTSPTVKTLDSWAARAQAGQHQRYDGTFIDADGSYSTLSNGGLTKWPSGNSQGKGSAEVMMYTFNFEQIVRNSEGANFIGFGAPPPGGGGGGGGGVS